MSKKINFKKFSSIIICFLLTAAMILSVTGCQKDNQPTEPEDSTSAQIQEQTKSFTFKVVDSDGNETVFDITTAEKTVGAALLKEGLIEGENSEYGLYVKKVNGITADYDIDGTYWAFYIGGTYASTGVDETEITDGETYSFIVQK